MSWLLVVLLAAVAFVLLAFVLKAPRHGWEAIGAALLLGIAGYGLQGKPDMPGAPKAPAETIASDPASLIKERQALSGSGAIAGDNWVVVADGLARNGQYANAAAILLGAVEKDPRNGEAWLAMGNALVSHAGGQLTPASLYAFRQAAEVAPDNPGPPFFLGLALAQSGRLGEARELWSRLLAGTPPDAPWRSDLEMRLARLDQFIAAQGRNPAGQ